MTVHLRYQHNKDTFMCFHKVDKYIKTYPFKKNEQVTLTLQTPETLLLILVAV